MLKYAQGLLDLQDLHLQSDNPSYSVFLKSTIPPFVDDAANNMVLLHLFTYGVSSSVIFYLSRGTMNVLIHLFNQRVKPLNNFRRLAGKCTSKQSRIFELL